MLLSQWLGHSWLRQQASWTGWRCSWSFWWPQPFWPSPSCGDLAGAGWSKGSPGHSRRRCPWPWAAPACCRQHRPCSARSAASSWPMGSASCSQTTWWTAGCGWSRPASRPWCPGACRCSPSATCWSAAAWQRAGLACPDKLPLPSLHARDWRLQEALAIGHQSDPEPGVSFPFPPSPVAVEAFTVPTPTATAG